MRAKKSHKIRFSAVVVRISEKLESDINTDH